MIAAAFAVLTLGSSAIGVELMRRRAGPYDTDGFKLSLVVFGILVVFWVGFFVGRMSA